MKKKPQGFTLVEMAILFVIMGIVAIVAIPQVAGTLETMHLNSASNKLMADIRYARELALSHHDIYGVDFNLAGEFYRIFYWNGASKVVEANPYGGQSMVIDFDVLAEYSGVEISAATALDVRFDEFGTPMDATGTAFIVPVTVTLQNGAGTRQIQITQETGLTELV